MVRNEDTIPITVIKANLQIKRRQLNTPILSEIFSEHHGMELVCSTRRSAGNDELCISGKFY